MYKYYELKQIEGELKILANKEEKPVFPYRSKGMQPTNGKLADKKFLMQWQSNHQIIPFYSKEEEKKVYNFTYFQHDIFTERFNDCLEKGIQIDCVEIQEIENTETVLDGSKYKQVAYFKSPEKETKPRLYTEDEMRSAWNDGKINKSTYVETCNFDFEDFINQLNK